ncbi:MAG: penicillin-binding transpeptidase domain-containing protein [Candidatus Omnitrophota bacterium]
MYRLAAYHRRVNAVFLFCFIFLFLCFARLLYIQFFRSEYLSEIAKKQHSLFVELEPRRGAIYDAKLRPQAVNLAIESLFASPREIPSKEKNKTVDSLVSVLGLDRTILQERLSRDKSFVWIARKLPQPQAEQIKQLNVKGLGFLKESKRCYPNGYLASHILGFAGLDNSGLEGIEKAFNTYLQGQTGWTMFLRDARQKKLDLSEHMVPPVDGYDIRLTIDEVIQYIAERELDKAYKIHHAKAASIIVMDPYTGAILAMANRPTYDLNVFSKANKEQIRNRSVCDVFEPGSVFKIVTASAALEEKKVKEQDTFFCENGAYKSAGHVLHDHKSHGTLTFKEVIEQSSNIGTVKVAQRLGPALLYKYIKLFGFGSKLGIDIPGEVSGLLKEPRFWSKTSMLALPMGQEVGVTALQLASALSVIANGGYLMQPYMISEIGDKYGQPIKQFSPKPIRRVISEDTALRVKKILIGVIENGTGKMAKVPGFSAAGKTGTAQKLDPNGRYSHKKFVGSFIGFAPAEEPLVTIVVTVDESHPYYFGGVVAAPVFKNVAGAVIRYLKTNKVSDMAR